MKISMTERIFDALVTIFLILSVQVIFIQTQMIHAQNMSSIVRVNNNKIIDNFLLLNHQPQVTVSGNKVYIVWVSHYTGNDDIYFTRSSDGGATFGNIINLSNDPGDSYNPHLSIVGNNVYVVWVDGTPGPYGNPDILFRASTNGGASFGPTINVSNNLGFSTEPEMAVSGNNIYIVWRDSTLGNEGIFFKRSINNGVSFGSPMYLSYNSSKGINSVRPQIVANANDVYIVWSNGNFDNGHSDVLFKRSINNGATFGITINISKNPTTLSTLQRIAISGSKVYVIWADGPFNKRQIFFKRSMDGGATFSNTTTITNATTGDSFNPQIAASSNKVYLLWQYDLGNISKQLFLKRSTDSGSSFSNTTTINQGQKDSSDALLNSSGNKVYVIWDDNSTGNSKIFFRKSMDAGANFTNNLSLSNPMGQSQYPSMVPYSNNIYAVWQDRIQGNIGIFFKRID